MSLNKLSRVAVLAAVVSTPAVAGDYRLLAPRDVYVDAYKNGVVHDPYLYPADQDLSYGMNFVMDMDIAKYKGYGVYMFNMLHFDQSDETGRIVHAGWKYELGLSLFPTKRDKNRGQIEVFHQHHSRHILEQERDAHFPVYDRVGIRFRIWP